jgi:single-strand DNA-binding protein
VVVRKRKEDAMNETFVTLIGNVVTDVTSTTTKDGSEVASFRMATTSRRYDKGISAWVDGDTSYVRVTAWRRLARHVTESITKGQPVVVHGTMKVREWEGQDGQRRTSVEIEALSLGHDLARGTSVFTRPARREQPDVVSQSPESSLAEPAQAPAA